MFYFRSYEIDFMQTARMESCSVARDVIQNYMEKPNFLLPNQKSTDLNLKTLLFYQ